MPTRTNDPDHAQRIKRAVRELYAQVAAGGVSCCGEPGADMPAGAENVRAIGYAEDAVRELPKEVLGANAGCGNPIFDARPAPGETVLDLGSGAGLDCFLAAGEVGPEGNVIGLDMTDAMLEKAEQNRRRMGLPNVRFQKGEMERMPIESGTIDIIISNCVINLSPDKPAVFREAFRALRPGGRFVVSDIIRTGESDKAGEGNAHPAGAENACCPADVEDGQEGEDAQTAEWCACIAGAIHEEEYLAGLLEAGFKGAEILKRRPYVMAGLESATIRAVKPGAPVIDH